MKELAEESPPFERDALKDDVAVSLIDYYIFDNILYIFEHYKRKKKRVCINYRRDISLKEG